MDIANRFRLVMQLCLYDKFYFLKQCYHLGGAYIPDAIAGGIIGGAIVGLRWESFSIVLSIFFLRWLAGFIAYLLGLVQGENRINIMLMNPHLQNGLYGNSKTNSRKA